MTAAPLWLIQNVRLADRDGLWQIAIDKGRFGAITPMGEAHDESYEVLNARGGLAIPPFIEPHIHDFAPRRRGFFMPLCRLPLVTRKRCER